MIYQSTNEMADYEMEKGNKMNQKHKIALFLLLYDRKKIIDNVDKTNTFKSRVISLFFFCFVSAIINPILMVKNKTIADVIGNGKWKWDVFSTTQEWNTLKFYKCIVSGGWKAQICKRI